jgi:hypothetical protein
MPFDPNIVREDDASFEGDLKLPDDLALMGEQLGDDAARLAAAYLPPVPAVLAAVSRQEKVTQSRRTSWLTRSLAGIALAAGLVTISLVASNSYRPQNANRSLPVVAPSPASGSLVEHEAPAPKDSQPQKIPVTPASWLGDTSGPELEALMDLWEQDQPAIRSLSF